MKLLLCVSSPEVICFNLSNLTLVPSWEESLCRCGSWTQRRSGGESVSPEGSVRLHPSVVWKKRYFSMNRQTWTKAVVACCIGAGDGSSSESCPPRMCRGAAAFWNERQTWRRVNTSDKKKRGLICGLQKSFISSLILLFVLRKFNLFYGRAFFVKIIKLLRTHRPLVITPWLFNADSSLNDWWLKNK